MDISHFDNKCHMVCDFSLQNANNFFFPNPFGFTLLRYMNVMQMFTTSL